MNEYENLILQWKELNIKTNKLLNKHKSFKNYNKVRLQMDKIELTLYKIYNINVNDLNIKIM